MWILIALGLVLLSIVSIGLFIFFGYRWSWTGFGETSYTKANGKQEVQPKKYFWDWLDLFLIPLALALVTVIFSFWQSSRQENIENQRAQYAALEEYLDQIGTLSLDRGLRTSHVDE